MDVTPILLGSGEKSYEIIFITKLFAFNIAGTELSEEEFDEEDSQTAEEMEFPQEETVY